MIGVILTNFGGPRSLEEVRPFLEDIFKDVLPRPLKLFARTLAKFRESYSKKMYASIGGASPVVAWTKLQAAALESKLRSPGKDIKVYTGMKYGHPSVAEAYAEAKDDGCERIIELPLFPYQSKYTTYNTQWHTHPLYIGAVVHAIKTALGAWKDVPPPDITLLFSVHAIPVSAIKAGDPYLKQVYESIDEIVRHFTGYNWQLAFQSAPRKHGWTRPFTKDIIRQLKPKNLVIVPLGFACENIETLYEIDKLYIPYAKKMGISNIARTPALNDNPQFIDLLAKMVLDNIK